MTLRRIDANNAIMSGTTIDDVVRRLSQPEIGMDLAFFVVYASVAVLLDRIC